MSVCNITGLLEDSAGNPMGATLTVTLDAPLLAGTALLTKKPVTFTIAGTGIINISLEESETSQITYYFELKSGSDYVVPPFHAIVPNTTAVIFWELLPVSAITDLLPAGLRRLAQIIATNPTYANAVKGWNPKGDYDPAAYYGKGDIVKFSGGSHLYVAETLTQGKTPTLFNGSVPANPIFWQTIAEKGDANSLAPQNDVYNDVTWDGNFLAPTKNSIRDALQLFARLDSPLFTGDPRVPTKGVGDSSLSAANTAFVANAIAALNIANYLTTAAAASTYLTQANAASTYLTQSNAASTYLAQSNAASTYATRANPTFTGTLNAAIAAFTGDATGVTPIDSDNDTSFATTAYVQNQASSVSANRSGAANLSITNGAITIVPFATETVDTHNQWDANSTFTCSRPGLYHVYMQGLLSLTGGTVSALASIWGIRINGTDLMYGTAGNFSTASWCSNSFTVRLANSDTLRPLIFVQWSIATGTPTVALVSGAGSAAALHIVRVAL